MQIHLQAMLVGARRLVDRDRDREATRRVRESRWIIGGDDRDGWDDAE